MGGKEEEGERTDEEEKEQQQHSPANPDTHPQREADCGRTDDVNRDKTHRATLATWNQLGQASGPEGWCHGTGDWIGA